jgi:uncharacterized protein YyaL (SSP411 family)
MNRLATETSPYLRQHRDNPVDWYPWGEEAFATAIERDRPILLSVGYSSCHWCHVMAHESFEDETTADMMNRLFVNVKVDREERPDVDAIYMTAVQAMTGQGGWPMTVFLTPAGEPFFGGTYFPSQPRPGMPSFTQLMTAVDDAWTERRDQVGRQAAELTAAVVRSAEVAGTTEGPTLDTLEAAADGLRDSFDPHWGGFGGAPKFPAAMALDALLRIHRRNSDDDLLDIVTTSIDAMAAGGIYDHLGGGFSRYSVDNQWLVPHFEKMLYDNALLARLYLHAWQVTGERRHLQVLLETVEYVLRDLTHPDGGFYSAQDADSEGIEGKYYVWSLAELSEVCGDVSDAAIAWYGAVEGGNFEGANILHRPVRGDLIRPEPVEQCRRALFERRSQRIPPGLDDKVLTEWNALMLSALAEAAAATANDRWREAAVRNGEFLLGQLRRADGRWMRSWQGGDSERPAAAHHLAYAHDHAALVDAFTRLGELTGEARWISAALETADALVSLFWDDDRDGVFTTGSDAETLVTRPKDVMDNATPSAQSLTAVALHRLAELTGRADLADRARRALGLVWELSGRHPTAFGHALAGVDLQAGGVDEIAVVGERPDLVRAVQELYLPSSVLAWGEPYPSPLWEGRDEGYAYVCRDFACRLPVSSVDELLAQLP